MNQVIVPVLKDKGTEFTNKAVDLMADKEMTFQNFSSMKGSLALVTIIFNAYYACIITGRDMSIKLCNVCEGIT